MTDRRDPLEERINRYAAAWRDDLPSPSPIDPSTFAGGEILARRWVIPAVAAAAAVAALVVGSVMLIDGNRSGPVRPASTPTSTSTTESAPQPSIDLASLPEGPPPGIPHVDGAEYVAADGSRHPIPTKRGVQDVVPWRDGFLVADTVYFEGTIGLSYVVDGRRVEEWPGEDRCSTGDPALGPEGQVAWAFTMCPETGVEQPPSTVHRADADGRNERTQAVDPFSPVIGFLGDEVIYEQGSVRGTWITDFANPPHRTPGPVTDVHPTTGRLLVSDADGWRVLETDGSTVWDQPNAHGPNAEAESFSPEGSRVLVRAGGREYVVLDAADGTTVAALTVPRWSRVIWEDEDHLLFSSRQRGQQAVVRTSLDRELELALPLVDARPQEPAYFLLRLD